MTRLVTVTASCSAHFEYKFKYYVRVKITICIHILDWAERTPNTYREAKNQNKNINRRKKNAAVAPCNDGDYSSSSIQWIERKNFKVQAEQSFTLKPKSEPPITQRKVFFFIERPMQSDIIIKTKNCNFSVLKYWNQSTIRSFYYYYSFYVCFSFYSNKFYCNMYIGFVFFLSFYLFLAIFILRFFLFLRYNCWLLVGIVYCKCITSATYKYRTRKKITLENTICIYVDLISFFSLVQNLFY